MSPKIIEKVITRYNTPNRMESLAYGQIIKVFHDDGVYTYYVQSSKDIENPDWTPWGVLLGKVFDDKIEDDEFLFTVLNKINENTPTPIAKIVTVDK